MTPSTTPENYTTLTDVTTQVDVGEEQIGVKFRFERLHRIARIRRFLNMITALPKELGRVQTQQRLILDDQYGLPNCATFGAALILHLNVNSATAGVS
jgi:hypothetical protein